MNSVLLYSTEVERPKVEKSKKTGRGGILRRVVSRGRGKRIRIRQSRKIGGNERSFATEGTTENGKRKRKGSKGAFSKLWHLEILHGTGDSGVKGCLRDMVPKEYPKRRKNKAKTGRGDRRRAALEPQKLTQGASLEEP